MLTIVCGVVNVADLVPVNGIAGISAIPAGAIRVVGIGASAPCAGETTAMVSSAASPARSATVQRVFLIPRVPRTRLLFISSSSPLS